MRSAAIAGPLVAIALLLSGESSVGEAENSDRKIKWSESYVKKPVGGGSPYKFTRCRSRAKVSVSVKVPMTLTVEQIDSLDGDSAIVFQIAAQGGAHEEKHGTWTRRLKDGKWKPGRRRATWVIRSDGDKGKKTEVVKARWSTDQLRLSIRLKYAVLAETNFYRKSGVGKQNWSRSMRVDAGVGIGLSGPDHLEMDHQFKDYLHDEHHDKGICGVATIWGATATGTSSVTGIMR